MKKITHFKESILPLVGMLLFVFIYSCETEDGFTAKSAPNANVSPIIITNGDYQTDCISTDTPFYVTTHEFVVNYGNNTKTINLEYYNTLTDFVLRVKSTNSWSNLLIDGVSVINGGNVPADEWRTHTMPLASQWTAGDMISFSLAIAGGGQQATTSISYNLFGACDESCSTTFEGEALACGTDRQAVYTFIAEEDTEYIKIQGGLTNFTGADAVVTIDGGALTHTQWTPGGSSNRVIKVEGSVAACEVITITIDWDSTNSGGIITGDWSVKDANGNDLAPSVPGLSCE
ncbi:hypothetical protein ACFS5J_00190 [Flavobacterium chuncheonense]|uniref:Lipoprotein n=1 Tax=Flavobacterium chuncheonense TaxID=2026653 RepID=A0ABW5YHF0_9FLAO